MENSYQSTADSTSSPAIIIPPLAGLSSVNQTDDNQEVQNNIAYHSPGSEPSSPTGPPSKKKPKLLCGCIRTDRYLGFIELKPGITWVHITCFYILVVILLSMFVFINAMSSYVFEAYLRGTVNRKDQGKLAGDLSFYNELCILAFGLIWGVLTDILRGRKFVYMIGFLFMGIGLFLYTFAETIWQLIIYRIIFAIGAASTSSMLTAIVGDYVKNKDRGKASGLLGLASGLGAVVSALACLKIPLWIQSADPTISTGQAGMIAFMIMAFFCIIAMCALMIFFKGRIFPICDSKQEREATRREMAESSDCEEEDDEERFNIKKSFIRFKNIIWEGLFVAPAKRPSLILAYISGFVARGDSILITTFITLWVSQQMIDIHDSSKADATARGGTISGICQTFALIAAPFVGIFADLRFRRKKNQDVEQQPEQEDDFKTDFVRKMSRLIVMAIVSAISGVGYTMLSFLTDVTGGFVYLPIALIGIGEIGVIICSQILVTAESPSKVRGSVSGIFTLFGAAGILVATKVGGYLFDDWKPSGPFLFYGVLNFALFIISIGFIIAHVIYRFKVGRNSNKGVDLK